MGKKFMKGVSTALVCTLILGNGIPASAARKVTLSAKKITVETGSRKRVTVKNAKKKVKWSVKSGKKYILLTKKTKKSVIVKGRKAGKAVLQAKIGKKKLLCRVTVKKKQSDKMVRPTAAPVQSSAVPSTAPQQTVLPVPSMAPQQTLSPAPEPTPGTTEIPESPTAAPTQSPSDGDETVKDIEIDLTGLKTTFTQTDVAAIDLSAQLGENFEASRYSSMDVTFSTDWEDESQKSGWAIGKVALAGTVEELDGKSDGIGFVYVSDADGGTATVALGTEVKGKTAVGINVQPMMDSDNNYKWPDGLTSVTVTKIVFRAPEGSVEPLPSKEFQYEGLDTAWLDANIDPDKPIVAMTFDDGPGGYGTTYENYGMQIQQALKDAGAHATFFYVGGNILKNEDTKNEVKQAVQWGFEVANHSYDYSELDKASADVIREKFTKTNEALKELTGFSNFLFRAPGVKYSDTMYSVIEAPFIDVSNWSNDWDNNVTKDQIVENVKKAKDGDIINMHSVHEKTAQAVPEILAYFKAQGIQVVSVSELYAIRGVKLMTGVKYSRCTAQ